MYKNFLVPIPDENKNVYVKPYPKKPTTKYVYYSYDRKYNSDDHFTRNRSTTIGKQCPEHKDKMYPNDNYFTFFPDKAAETVTDIHDKNPLEVPVRSKCQRIGTYVIIRRIIWDLKLDSLLGSLMGRDAGLFMDLAAYMITNEENSGQYYPDYAFNHPLFTEKMKVYSDSKVSSFLQGITRDQEIDFQNEWNREHPDKKDRIYISYDSTNKNCQAGDVELVEIGHPKDDKDKPIFNYAVGYNQSSGEPMFYEEYPGSIVDISQLHYMVEKARGYGYQNIGFTIDRGYFSKPNIHEMDRCGYAFVIMMKGCKKLVRELVLKKKGTFEDKSASYISGWGVYGTTGQHQLYLSDDKQRYFHIYFSDSKKTAEKHQIEEKVEHLETQLTERIGKPFKLDGEYKKYFSPIYDHEGQKDEVLKNFIKKNEVIDDEISFCGYFVIITSEKMTTRGAYELYKSRDASEKLFRADKSFLGNRAERVYSTESVRAKILIGFAALIIRNRIYQKLQERMKETKTRHNYMTVPNAIRELEKIEIIKQLDGNYRLDYALSATQKDILKAFNLNEAKIRNEAEQINKELKKADEQEEKSAG